MIFPLKKQKLLFFLIFFKERHEIHKKNIIFAHLSVFLQKIWIKVLRIIETMELIL